MIALAVLLCYAVLETNCSGLKEEFTWTRIDYVWSSQSRFGRYRPYRPHYGSQGTREDGFTFPGAVNTGRKTTTTTTTEMSANLEGGDGVTNVDYIYQNNIPMGANRWNDKLFITVPRRRNGVPSTLNYVSMSSQERHNVPLTPYPNLETNQLNADPSQRLVSVYRVAVDQCDRLWMVDTGIIEIPGNRTDIQPHSIVIIDLKTDQIIRRYSLKDTDLRPPTILSLIVVDVTSDSCDNAFAYMPDLAGYGLVVYSFKDNNSWRVSHNYFYLEPWAGDFNIGGQIFQWNDGVFSVALSDLKRDGSRDVYFHSMAGTHLYKVSSKVLQNETLATRSYHEKDFKVLGDRGANSQTSASDLHKPSGILFLNLVNQNALGCWNTNQPFKKENFDVVQKDDTKMIYPCDLKVYQNDVIVLTNNMPIFLYSTLNYDETNFRVWMNSVEGAVQGTNCAGKKRTSGHGLSPISSESEFSYCWLKELFKLPQARSCVKLLFRNLLISSSNNARDLPSLPRF